MLRKFLTKKFQDYQINSSQDDSHALIATVYYNVIKVILLNDFHHGKSFCTDLCHEELVNDD